MFQAIEHILRAIPGNSEIYSMIIGFVSLPNLLASATKKIGDGIAIENDF